MKAFEFAYVCAEPFLPPLYSRVRKSLQSIARSYAAPIRLLDTGGRKSHYTVNVPALVTITDVPRESDLQKRLNLGLNQSMISQTRDRRTNIREILFDDMTRSLLEDGSFDIVVSVEVLEHVEEDGLFLDHVHRVLKPGGTFLMTTPNGDYLRKPNTGHVRHYTREQLGNLLSSRFSEVHLEYAIKGGVFHRWGLRSISAVRPHRAVLTAVGNVINSLESRPRRVKNQGRGTHHLIAVARKQADI